MKDQSRPPAFRRIGIIGLGLMGGSLARSLKALPAPPHIRALSVDSTDLELGVGAGVVDEAMSTEAGFFDGLDLVVYCTPLNATLRLLKAHRGLLESGTLITDVVSLKAPILDMAGSLGIGSALVGSHPLAGGEGKGFSFSRDDLYRDARVWIVAGEAPLESVEKVEGFWASLGARGARIGAGDHDDKMVWVSHLPQLTSNALASALGARGIGREELGPGGISMTRLAGSSPEMWQDLLEHAPEALSDALEAVEVALSEIRKLIRQGKVEDVTGLFERSGNWYKGGKWS